MIFRKSSEIFVTIGYILGKQQKKTYKQYGLYVLKEFIKNNSPFYSHFFHTSG